jgi:hypothetical protein
MYLPKFVIHKFIPMYYNQAIQQPLINSILERDPDEWITGTELMTIDQRIYLKTLCQEAGESFDGTLSKAAATARIKLLQEKIGKKLNS